MYLGWAATGPYNSTDVGTVTTIVRLNEHSFVVDNSNNIYLIHYNLILSANSTGNKQISTTLGISTTPNDTAGNSYNLQNNTQGIILNGPINSYIAASGGNVASGDLTNIIGCATVRNLTPNKYYITLWAASTGTSSFSNPKVLLTILRIQ